VWEHNVPSVVPDRFELPMVLGELSVLDNVSAFSLV
jgi:hypothetical protein